MVGNTITTVYTVLMALYATSGYKKNPLPSLPPCNLKLKGFGRLYNNSIYNDHCHEFKD